MRKINKKLVIFAFWCLIVFSFFSIIKIFLTYPFNFNIKGLTSTLENISINIELKQKIPTKDMLICFNKNCVSSLSDNFNNVYFYEFNYKDPNFYNEIVNNIQIAFSFPYKNTEIEKIYLTVGNKSYYYTKDEISKFQKKNYIIKLDNTKDTQSYHAYILPKINNYKGVINHLTIIFLSLFSNWTVFLIPYFWLFVAYLIYLFHKDYFNFKFKYKNSWVFIAIILLCMISRAHDLTYIPLWADETYTQTIALDSFKSIFQDAGNPPLFYFLEFIFIKIFSNNILTLRILPFIFGILTIPAVYVIFKDISKNTALFACFLASINSIFIYHSQEARGYSLYMLLSICAVYVLFKYLDNPNKKNLLIYTVVSFLLINSNYYLTIFVFTNMIWGLASLFENKNKDKILSFFSVNCLCALSFLPYFIYVSNKALNDSFNGWIPQLNSGVFAKTIETYFFSKYLFIFLCLVVLFNLIICYIPKLKVNKKKEDLYLYLVYSFAFILIILSLISIFIKPILDCRLLLSLYGLLFLLEVLTIVPMFEIEKQNKWFDTIKALYFIIVLGIYLNIAAPSPARRTASLNDFMFLIEKEAPYYHNLGYEIHGVIPDYTEYVKGYPEVAKLDYIKWHTRNNNSGELKSRIKRSDYVTSNNKAVIFASPIGFKFDLSLQFDPRIYGYRSNLTTTLKHISERKAGK